MHSQHATLAFCQDREVASCLRRLDHAEGVLLTGHRQIHRVIAGDLQEDSSVGSAFVSLSGRVQEARAKAKARRYSLPVADRMANPLKTGFMLLVHLYEG